MQTTRRSFLASSSLVVAPLLVAQTTPGTNPGPAADISGKWQFVFDTEGGNRDFQADFKVIGKAVTGTWNGKAEVKGTIEDAKLELEFPTTSDEVGEGTLKMSGKVSDTITGTWSFQSYSGTFKATRSKA